MLTKDQIISAMTLDADGVTAALRNNDYQDGVLTAVFMGMNSDGSFVYDCTYNDTYSGTEEVCTVYVHFNERMQMVAEY